MVEIGNRVFFARAIPSVDIYEVLELTIRSSSEKWVVGVDTSTRQAFTFDRSDVGTLIFFNKTEADEIVKSAKKKYGTHKFSKEVSNGEE